MILAHVVFATITGNNEEIADIISELLDEAEIQVTETEISQTDVFDFVKSDLLIVCAYTYDEGSMPEECRDFYEDLKMTDLTNKVFGVAGSGDKSYCEYYNLVVDMFSDVFKHQGAIQGFRNIKINLEPAEADIEILNKAVKNIVEVANNLER